jgi:phospholipid/cholesterol/gamma-HCH transport system substrate-binding protein
MENRAYALAAGLFTLLLGIGVVLTALWFSGETVVTQNYLLVSRHPVSGLNPQAPVRYRGVTVGKVVSIKFDPLEPRTILVEISVEKGTPLTKGTFARLGSQGVTGLSYVMLDDEGSKPEPLTADGGNLARIEVKPSFFDSVTASGEDLLNNFNHVAKRVSTLLSDENQKQLVTTLRNLDQASAKVVSLGTTMESTVKALAPTLKALPALVSQSSAALNDAGIVLKRADTTLANVNTLVANFNQRVDSFERAAKSAEQLGNQGAALSEAMMTESIPRLNLLLDDLQYSSRRLERLLYDINEQPHSFVFGRNPLPPGPGEPGFARQRGTR